MSDFLTTTPNRQAPADFLERALRLAGMTEADPATTIGAIDGMNAPTRLLRGARADSWADLADAFGDHGFRLHPDTDEFPAVAQFCASSEDGQSLIASYCEGDVSVSSFATYEDACAWIGVEHTTAGSAFAFART